MRSPLTQGRSERTQTEPRPLGLGGWLGMRAEKEVGDEREVSGLRGHAFIYSVTFISFIYVTKPRCGPALCPHGARTCGPMEEAGGKTGYHAAEDDWSVGPLRHSLPHLSASLPLWLLEAVAQLHTGAPGCTGPPWGSPTATALEFRPAPTPACAHLEVWGDGGAEAWRRGFPRAWSSGEGRPASLLCRAQLDDTPPTAPASFPLPPRGPHSGPWSYTPR